MSQPTFSDALNAGLELASTTLEDRSRERRAQWITRERHRSWGWGFACGVVACIAIAGGLRAGEAWGAAPAPAGVQLAVDRLVRHHVPHLMADCRDRTCAAYSNTAQLQLVLVLDYLPERSAPYYRVTQAVG